MSSFKGGRSILLTLALGAFAGSALASDCGNPPQEPEIIDGATATMEDLVANSESVKTYISEADSYLDCREGIVKSDAFKEMSKDDQKAFQNANSDVLKSRNNIGEKFNAEVADYKKANPS
ncbi:MAG: hypothetical protein WC997_04500 [Porticoccaceae bacterium]